LCGILKDDFRHLHNADPNEKIGAACGARPIVSRWGSFIAHRIGTEKPGMVREGNFILVVNQQGKEIAQVLWLQRTFDASAFRRRISTAYRNATTTEG
jgi:hypothetical protein